MASRANIETSAFKNGISFNEAKRRLGAKHAKGTTRPTPAPPLKGKSK